MRALTRARLIVRHNETLGSVMHSLAEVHGSRTLVEEDDGSRLTYLQAAKRVSRWAAGVQRQAPAGGRVVIHTPNHYELFLLCLAVSRAGCIPVPVNPLMRHDETMSVHANMVVACHPTYVTERTYSWICDNFLIQGAAPSRMHAFPETLAELG